MKKETLLRFIALALAIAEKELPCYSHKFAPKRYTLAQLCACCLLRVALRQDLRSIETLLSLSAELRKAIGLKRVPDHSTLCRFERHWLTAERADRMLGEISRKLKLSGVVAADSTGLQPSAASSYFQLRQGVRCRAYVKLSILVALGWLIAIGAVGSIGPSNDRVQLRPLLKALPERMEAKELLADAGYDAEWVHEWCRESQGLKSWIPAVVRRKDGKVGGRWRNLMAQGLPKHYGRRWGVESFFSGLKRTLGSTLRARTQEGQVAEVVVRALVYSLRR